MMFQEDSRFPGNMILYFLLPLFLLGELHAEQKIVYMTTPKGGSQLLRKAISMIVPLPLKKLPSPQECSDLEKDDVIAYHHLEPGYDFIKNDKEDYIKIVMIRDPRDVIVSMNEWIKVMADTPLASEFLTHPQEEQLHELIENPNLQMNGFYPYVFDTKLAIKEALSWVKNPSVFLCRFEDLIGEKGGGSREKQEETIAALAMHLKKTLPTTKIQEIADSLFGDTVTFRKGQIGSWKEAFTPHLKEVCKKAMGQELIELGYETNFNW